MFLPNASSINNGESVTTDEQSRWWSMQHLQESGVLPVALTTLKLTGYTLVYLISVLTTISAIIGLCLLFRWLRLTLGSRTKPDGSKAILITGATSGIGLVIAKHFHKLGFSVIAAYFNDKEPGYTELLKLSMAQGQVEGPRLFLVRMDVRSRVSIEKSSQEVNEILDKHQMDLFALINNAAISRDANFEWVSREAILDVVETNLIGVMLVTRQFLYRIIKARGRVINTSSGLYQYPFRGASIYGASKSAIAFFSAVLDADIKVYGASCRCIFPGNFIAASNIIFPYLSSVQDSISKLTDEEKALYKDSIEGLIENMDQAVRKRFSLDSSLDPAQISSLYRVRLPDDLMSGQLEMNKPKVAKLNKKMRLGPVEWLVSKLDGGKNANLETSGLIEAYEQAIRLQNCPKRLYAGNWIYTNFSGPGQDYVPKLYLDWMATRVGKSFRNP